MSEWIKQLVTMMLLISVVLQMLPGNQFHQYVKLFTGLVLILLILRPILKIGSADVYLEQKITEFVEDQKRLESQIMASGDEFRVKSEELQGKEQENILIEEVKQVQVEVILE